MASMRERIEQAIKGEYKGVDGLIAAAYWIGKHDGAKEVCDHHAEIVREMRVRAQACRYHNMAQAIIGDNTRGYEPDVIYHSDYSSDFTDYTVEDIDGRSQP